MKLDSFTNKLLAVWMATKWAVTQTLFQHKNNQERTKLSEMARKSLSSLSFTCQQIRWIHEKLFPKKLPSPHKWIFGVFEMKFWIFFLKTHAPHDTDKHLVQSTAEGIFFEIPFFFKKKKKLRRWRPYPKEVDGRLKWFRCRASGFSRATASTGKREATGKKKKQPPGASV